LFVRIISCNLKNIEIFIFNFCKQILMIEEILRNRRPHKENHYKNKKK